MVQLQGPMDTETSTLSKGERTRIRILEATMEAVAKEGFENVVLNDVAKIAGVTRGCLLQHFDSRETLMAQAQKYLAGRGQGFTLRFLEEHQGEFPPVIIHIEATFEWIRQNRNEADFTTYLLMRAGYDKRTQEFIDASFAAGRARMALQIMDWATQNQAVISSPEATRLAFHIHSLLIGNTFLTLGRSESEVLKIKENCKEAALLLLEASI